jgi:hypothetical protein
MFPRKFINSRRREGHALRANSAKEFLGPLKEASVKGRVFFIAERRKFLQLPALLRIQLRRYFHHTAREQITAAAAVDVCDSSAAQFEYLSALGPGGNFDVSFAVKRRHWHFATERSEREGDWHFAVKIVFVALKHRMLFDMEHDIKVSGRPASNTSLAVSR